MREREKSVFTGRIMTVFRHKKQKEGSIGKKQQPDSIYLRHRSKKETCWCLFLEENASHISPFFK